MMNIDPRTDPSPADLEDLEGTMEFPRYPEADDVDPIGPLAPQVRPGWMLSLSLVGLSVLLLLGAVALA